MVQATGEGADGHAPEAFISYASQDAGIAKSLVAALEDQGIRCWIAPRDVTGGAFYADAIVHAIDGSKATVLILSRHAAASPHVVREIERAASKRHPIISVRLDSDPLPAGLEYFLNTSQWLNADPAHPLGVLPALVSAIRSGRDGGTLTHTDAANGSGASALQPNRSRRTAMIVAGVIAALALGFTVYRAWAPRDRTSSVATMPPVPQAAEKPAEAPAAAADSVAVLPFVDMSEKRDQEYFADGLSEELIDHLAQLSNLKVIARTSSFQFKGKSDDVRVIGQRLGAANLLEGSVRTSGRKVRVTAQLIRAQDGINRWSQTYDGDLHDIFRVQDAIAQAVVAALKAQISAAPSNSTKSVNPEAYKAVLRGRYFRERGTKEGLEQSAHEFEEALRIDPTYAVASAELARSYNTMGVSGWLLPRLAAEKTRAAANHALKLDPTSALAHRELAAVAWNYDFDFATARAEERRATELDPYAPEVTANRGLDALEVGRPAEAAVLFKQVVDRDPLNPEMWNFLLAALWNSDQTAAAEHAARTILELSPQFEGGRCALGEVLLEQGKTVEAERTMRAETDEATRAGCLPYALRALGRTSEADAILASAEAKFANSAAIPIAAIYVSRGDNAAAFKWLDRAYENREPYLTLIQSDKAFRGLHQDPRWVALMQKLNLPH
jgi:adenylate cyclase